MMRLLRRHILGVLVLALGTNLLVPSPASALHAAPHQTAPTPMVPFVSPPGVFKAVCQFSGGFIRSDPEPQPSGPAVHGHLGWFASDLSCPGDTRGYSGRFEFNFNTDGPGFGSSHGETCSTGFSNDGWIQVGWAGSGPAAFQRSSTSLEMWGEIDPGWGPKDYIYLDLTGPWCASYSLSVTGTAMIWGEANDEPFQPWLTAPEPGYTFQPVEDQLFTVETFDYENDPWVAHVRVVESGSGTVTEFTMPTTNGFSATGSPPQSLPPGYYTWTATARDALGGESERSDESYFYVAEP